MPRTIAKSAIRQTLWDSLGLTQADGTHWRTDTLHETIVLSLKPHVDTRAIPSTWEGFRVEVVPYHPIRVHA